MFRINVTALCLLFIQGTGILCSSRVPNNFIVSNFDLMKLNILQKHWHFDCMLCLQWNAAPWICNPVFCMRWSLLTNQSASQRLAMPISPRHEREAALSVASREVTIEQHHGGLLSVTFRKWASTAAGCALQYAQRCSSHIHFDFHHNTNISYCGKISI